MKKSDLKVGYVVKRRDGSMCMVLPNDDGILALSGPTDWCPLDEYSDELTNRYSFNGDIVEVYGRCSANRYAHFVATNHRRLLWKRSETKKMTVAEICKELGYDVEIVKED